MSKTREYVLSERPVRQYRATEGRAITREEIERFLTNYETLDRVEGTFQFYRRKMRKFYEDLPEDKTVQHGTLEKWQEKLLREGYAPSTVNSFLWCLSSLGSSSFRGSWVLLHLARPVELVFGGQRLSRYSWRFFGVCR